MKDYKYLVSRHDESPPSDNPEKPGVKYFERPAWRDKWWKMVLLAVLPFVFIMAFFRGEEYFKPEHLRVVFVIMGAVFVYLFAGLAYHRYSWQFMIDRENIESHEGLIARNVRSIRVQDLRNINVNQTLFQRILGVGDVEFSSAGGSGIEVTFFGVDDPLTVKAMAQRLQGH